MKTDIVKTDKEYSALTLYSDLEFLRYAHPEMQLLSVGKSLLGQDIPFVILGTGEKKIFINAAHHASEWITTPVVMKFIEEFLNNYDEDTLYRGYNIDKIWSLVSIYIVPMVNPDGVNLQQGLLPKLPEYYYDVWQPYENNLSIWKANIRGVDLNLQYPVGWESAKKIKFAQKFDSPGPTQFVGPNPLSELESRAIYNLTNNNQFEIVISMHAQGKEIYYEYQGHVPPGSLELGERFARVSGYALEHTPTNSSYAGFTDWFIDTFDRPAYTIEVGEGVNPLSIEQFDEIYDDVVEMFLIAAEYVMKI